MSDTKSETNVYSSMNQIRAILSKTTEQTFEAVLDDARKNYCSNVETVAHRLPGEAVSTEYLTNVERLGFYQLQILCKLRALKKLFEVEGMIMNDLLPPAKEGATENEVSGQQTEAAAR